MAAPAGQARKKLCCNVDQVRLQLLIPISTKRNESEPPHATKDEGGCIESRLRPTKRPLLQVTQNGLLMRRVSALLIGFTAGILCHHLLWTRSNSLYALFPVQEPLSDELDLVMEPSESLSSLSLPQEQWRLHLKRLLDIQNVSNYRKGSFGQTVGCGFSSKLRLGSSVSAVDASSRMNPTSKTLEVYLKSVHCRNQSHVDSESHLREIKAAYLDRILQTHVVPPTVGHEIRYQTFYAALADKSTRALLSASISCLPKSQQAKARDKIQGSVMLYLDQVETTNVTVLHDHALAYVAGIRNVTTVSAINYIAFVYLAGCLKTTHNHFMLGQQHFLAIDNDRCFTSQATLTSMNATEFYWDRFQFGKLEQILSDTCSLPVPLVSILEQAYGTMNQTRLLSQQLREALQQDILADELLALQPETMEEVDERAHRLWKHIESCRAKRGPIEARK